MLLLLHWTIFEQMQVTKNMLKLHEAITESNIVLVYYQLTLANSCLLEHPGDGAVSSLLVVVSAHLMKVRLIFTLIFSFDLASTNSLGKKSVALLQLNALLWSPASR